ncbi:AN1-type zinc finger protein 2A isoform X1 [Pongo abelii]|uniref:AN1-type zinc finger protein 2A isoform X1 n=1 Tax=Pongo abelii TaxID=9601 RepID=UPI0030059B37
MFLLGAVKEFIKAGTVAHTCNLSTLGGQGGRIQLRLSLRPAWATWQDPISTKIDKISWVWRCVPVVPGTRLKQENHLSPGGRGCSEPRWSHCTPPWATERDPVSKKRIACLKSLCSLRFLHTVAQKRAARRKRCCRCHVPSVMATSVSSTDTLWTTAADTGVAPPSKPGEKRLSCEGSEHAVAAYTVVGSGAPLSTIPHWLLILFVEGDGTIIKLNAEVDSSCSHFPLLPSPSTTNLGGSNHRNRFFHSSGGWKTRRRMSAGPAPSEACGEHQLPLPSISGLVAAQPPSPPSSSPGILCVSRLPLFVRMLVM